MRLSTSWRPHCRNRPNSNKNRKSLQSHRSQWTLPVNNTNQSASKPPAYSSPSATWATSTLCTRTHSPLTSSSSPSPSSNPTNSPTCQSASSPQSLLPVLVVLEHLQICFLRKISCCCRSCWRPGCRSSRARLPRNSSGSCWRVGWPWMTFWPKSPRVQNGSVPRAPGRCIDCRWLISLLSSSTVSKYIDDWRKIYDSKEP